MTERAVPQSAYATHRSRPTGRSYAPFAHIREDAQQTQVRGVRARTREREHSPFGRCAGPDESALVGVDDDLDAVPQAEFLKYAGDVCLGCGVADEESFAALRVGPPGDEQVEDLALARRQRGHRLRGPTRGWCRAPDELLDDRPRDRRGEEGVPIRNDPDRCRGLLEGRVLYL